VSGERRRIVVVGCGFGGATAVRRLAGRVDARAELIALDAGTDFYNYTILPRTLVEDVEPAHVTVPLRTLFDGLPVDLRVEKVIGIDAAGRTLHTRRAELRYDVLVIAVGSRAVPLPRDDDSLVLYPKASRHLDRLRAIVRRAITGDGAGNGASRAKLPRRFAIVGGGLTGIEFAVTLREAIEQAISRTGSLHREFQVDLFESAPRLIPRHPPRFSDHLQALLERRGVRVFVNSHVGEVNANSLIVEGGPVPVDVTLCCIGSRPNLNMEISGLGDAREGLPVNPFLQSIADPRVFALGDDARIEGLSDAADTKFASQAVRQGRVVAENVWRMLAGGPLRAYRPGAHPVGVMLGAKRGSLAYRGWHWTGRLPGLVKRYLETHVP
jgi:NADH dehydrogenase FAD-containing subunit